MTEDATTGQGEWRRTCEVCGSELEPVQLDFADADFSEGRTGTPLTRDVCPNPECPRHLREVGEPAEDDASTRPGSLGGDNGGG